MEYYEKAVKYTTPYSSHYTIIALLHIGLVRYLQAKFQEACKATLEVIKFSPNHYKAHYQYTQYCANLGRYDEAIKHLRIAIKGNRYYCIKADAEKDFDVMKKQLKALFKELRDEAYSIAKKEIEKTQKFIQDLKRVYDIPDTYIKEYIKELNKAENLFQRNSYFDYLDSYLEVVEVQKVVTVPLIEYFSKKKDELLEEIAIPIQDYKTNLLFTRRIPMIIALPMIIAFVVLLIVGVPFWKIIVYLIFGEILLTILRTILRNVYIFFLRRKHLHDQNICKSNLEKIQTQLDQLQNEEIVKKIIKEREKENKEKWERQKEDLLARKKKEKKRERNG